MSTWMKDALVAVLLGFMVLGMVLIVRYEGPIVFGLPIGMTLVSFLSDTWWHRKKRRDIAPK